MLTVDDELTSSLFPPSSSLRQHEAAFKSELSLRLKPQAPFFFVRRETFFLKCVLIWIHPRAADYTGSSERQGLSTCSLLIHPVSDPETGSPVRVVIYSLSISLTGT